MVTFSILHVLTILTPTFFVLALGYAAGRYHLFDAEKSKGVTELVLAEKSKGSFGSSFYTGCDFSTSRDPSGYPSLPGVFSRVPPSVYTCFLCYKEYLSPDNRRKFHSGTIGNIPFYLVFRNFFVGGLFGTSSGISISISVIIAVGILVPLTQLSCLKPLLELVSVIKASHKILETLEEIVPISRRAS